jgi:hypothetical protein
VLFIWSPLLLPIKKGKREKEELNQEMHHQDSNAMVDAVAMAGVIF